MRRYCIIKISFAPQKGVDIYGLVCENKNRRKNSKEAFLNECKIETIAKSNGQLKTCPRTRAQPVRENECHGEQG